MKILQVVHDFLPRHLAGVEVYTDELSRRLALEHEVGLLYSESVPEQPNYSLHPGTRERIATFELVNNHTFRRFEETYSNAPIDKRIAKLLDEFRPDIVHIQHLLNLSINLVQEAHRRGIPVIMTLHDHWLACANGGQRFHRQLGRCEELDPDRCGQCTAEMVGQNSQGTRASGWLRQRDRAAEYLLVEEVPVEMETADASNVYKDHYDLDGELRPTWVAHPPARLRFDVTARKGAHFAATVALHPSTFEKTGGGVRFVVAVDGEERFSRVLDPKRRPEDRVPVPIRIPLASKRFQLELRTEGAPPEDVSFCTGGWINPRIEQPAGPRRAPTGPVEQGIELAAWLGRMPQRRRITRRWKAIRKMASMVDLFIAPSRYLRDEFIGFGIQGEKIVFCDYGFRIDRLEQRRNLPDLCRRFAFVGSLVPHKGVHILLQAFLQMPEDAELHVCGSFDYDPIYSRQLRAGPNHPGVRFVGQLANQEVPSFLASVDCLVVPSIWHENSPLTIHEAFLAGVPVVASNLGGHPGLLGGGGGLLYQADDAADLAANLLRLYGESGLGRSLAATSPEVKPMNEHVGELCDIYARLLA